MTEPREPNNTRTTARRRLLALAAVLALIGIGTFGAFSALGNSESGAESTTTTPSVASQATTSTSGIPVSTTIPGATTIPAATTIPRATTNTRVTAPGATIPAATTIPAAATTVPDVTGPSLTLTLDRDYIYDGTLDCPQQTVDFTVTVSDPSSPVTILVLWQNNFGLDSAIDLGGGRYRIPRQNIAPGPGRNILAYVEASDGLGNTSQTQRVVAYIDAAFPPCTP